MSWSSRLFLIVAAAWFGGYWVSIASIFSASPYGLRPDVDTVRLTMRLIALGLFVSFPIWLPALIPTRFRLLSRIARWISALIMLIPTWLWGTTVTHNVSRWLKGFEAWPSIVAEGLLGSACSISVIVVLLWPEVRQWLRASVKGINQNEGTVRKSIWEKVLIGLGILFFLAILIGAIQAGYFILDMNTSSELSIRNWSGSDVRFEKLTIDGQPVWEKPDIVIKTIKNFEKPWLDTRGDSISPRFRAPKKNVELKLVILNELQERETLSCTLDNRLRPSSFEVFYYKGKLFAHNLREGHRPQKRGPHGDVDLRPNWPPEWAEGPHKQPIK